MKKAVLRLLLAGSALFPFSISAQAAVILTVDISNPALIRFEATGAASSLSDSTVNFTNGITLVGFFSESITRYTATALSNQDLVALTTTPDVWQAYASVRVVDYANGVSSVGADLNLFGSPAVQSFSTGSAAFSGYDEIDFFFSTLPFASIGTIGNIVLGSSQSNGRGDVIGQFQIIPEPSSVLLIGLSSLLLVTRFCRKRVY